MGTSEDARDKLTVTHDAPERRFEVTVEDGCVADFLAYDQVAATTAAGKDTIVIIHTIVQPEHEGQGVGSALARAALDHAREKKMIVIPECTFVRAFIERHPEYQDLLP
jgi:predicted GNAT family acetyltransferase